MAENVKQTENQTTENQAGIAAEPPAENQDAEREEIRDNPPAEPPAPAKGRGPFKPLFLIALALAAALAGACGWLALQRQAGLDLQGELGRRLAALEQELADQRAALAHQRQELDQRQAELDKAEETIGLLSQYTLVSPEGEPPDYAALYPDFYAPDWEGETVSGGKRCYLTFDDGPSPNTDRILEVLDRYGVKATFFVVGYEARTAAGQERMRRIVAEGHALAMHSWSHDYKKVYASVEGFLEDFYRLYQYIHEVTGEYPALFRFPGGSINGYDRGVYQEIIAEMTRRGFVYFDWNASAQDATVYPRPAWDISADCLKGIGRELVVVLAHDSGARGTTVDALPAVIEGYRNAGYTLEALHPGVEPVHMGYPKIR